MFCTNCGTKFEGKFCPNCGTPAGNTSSNTAPVSDQCNVIDPLEEKVLWEGEPSGILGKAKSASKINDLKYTITNQRIIIESGLIGKKKEEIELGFINDYYVKQSIAERIQKIGDVMIVSSDSTAPVIVLDNVENPDKVKEIIRTAVMKYRKDMNITQIQGI